MKKSKIEQDGDNVHLAMRDADATTHDAAAQAGHAHGAVQSLSLSSAKSERASPQHATTHGAAAQPHVPHTMSTALARDAAPQRSTASEEALAKIVWRQAPAVPSDDLQQSFAALQMRRDEEAVSSFPSLAPMLAGQARVKSEPSSAVSSPRASTTNP